MNVVMASRSKVGLALVIAGTGLLAGCGGGSGTTAGSGPGGKATLIRMEYGRLVDVYAYRRTDPQRADRRDILNREIALVARDMVVSPSVQTQSLFDAAGEENTGANFRFLPFDVSVGHEELLVLWDDTNPNEKPRFDQALAIAQRGLVEVPASYRSQNTSVRPIPVVPRNAALVLTFDHELGLSASFFDANPGAIQLLQFLANPLTTPATQAYRPVLNRVIVEGDQIIMDTTLIGGEAQGGQTSTGLPPSEDNKTANLRVAIAIGGVIAPSFNVDADPVPALNGPNSSGDPSVIRDFRSGNKNDGAIGALTDIEAPMVVADVGMGITAVDTANRVLTLNKRYSQVAVRGRIPFVVGGIVSATGFPGGGGQVPTEVPLRSGDIVFQDVQSPTGETVRVRSEILENIDVGNVVGDPSFPGLGLASDGTDGGTASTVRVRVSSLTATDSEGNEVSFTPDTLPLGRECTVRVHYYHRVPYAPAFGSSVVSDADRANEFLMFEPAPPRLDANRNPIPPGTLIDPHASVSLRFSEPMDLLSVQPYDNFSLSNNDFRPDTSTPPQWTVAELFADPKPASLSILTTRLTDHQRDGTVLRLTPPLGHFHRGPDSTSPNGTAETYWFHMLLQSGNPDDIVSDLAGNPVELYDRDLLNPLDTWSVPYTLDPAAADNLVGWRIMRFAASDEDGTPPGSVDFFGQFQIGNGELSGAPTSRFSEVADGQTLQTINRVDKGQCWDPNAGATVFPPGGGVLYLCPSNVLVQPVAPLIPWNNATVMFGGISEPLNPRGSRLQMTYREDDFSLSYTDPSTMMIDVEQMHWAPWSNHEVEFDQFDRVTIEASHADWRPDIRFSFNPGMPMAMPPVPASCDIDCASMFSGLRTTFAQNPLQGSTPVALVKDKVYQVNPNLSFRAPSLTTFVPYPKFEQTYTWRDSRLVSWDRSTDTAVGLSGAKQPQGSFPAKDTTADISSPWVPEELPAGFTNSVWSVSDGDFRGDRVRDLDPIAMPLMLDFKVFPDDPRNGVASGVNEFHIGYAGPCWMAPPYPPNSPGGYYNSQGLMVCNFVDWPTFRVHTSGGVDAEGREIFVDPENTFTAKGGWIIDVGLGDPTLGRFQTKPGDDHVHWAQADFLRRVSMVTFGFFDTLRPNQQNLGATYQTPWPGLSKKGGFPDFVTLQQERQAAYGMSDFVSVIDPPEPLQPAGTSVRVEYRFASTFENGTIYDQANDDTLSTRGNLLNPNYACEAYRYASPNSGETFDQPRIRATGLTPYVDEEGLDSLRDTRGQLPQMMNFRIIFTNNTDEALTPSLRSLGFAYRMASR